MLKIIALLALFVLVALLCVRKTRAWLVEQLKASSDLALLLFLRLTSEFGGELTREGEAEQRLWREQRLRNLQGLTLRSKQALSSRQSAVSSNKSAGDSRKESVS